MYRPIQSARHVDTVLPLRSTFPALLPMPTRPDVLVLRLHEEGLLLIKGGWRAPQMR